MPGLLVPTTTWAVDGQRKSLRCLATVRLFPAIGDVNDFDDGSLSTFVTRDRLGAKRIVQHAHTMGAEVAGDKMRCQIEKRPLFIGLPGYRRVANSQAGQTTLKLMFCSPTPSQQGQEDPRSLPNPSQAAHSIGSEASIAPVPWQSEQVAPSSYLSSNHRSVSPVNRVGCSPSLSGVIVYSSAK